MTTAEKALKDGIRSGEFMVACGEVYVCFDYLLCGSAYPGPVRGVMPVLVYAWQGSGFPPEHHSLS